MVFPAAQRVIYAKNPLLEVVCQVRFPPILRIDAEAPVTYQEAIRQDYPVLQRAASANLPPDLPDALRQIVESIAPGIAGKQDDNAYHFLSADGIWTSTLAKDFLALSTKRYTTWQDFYDRFARTFQVLNDTYAPQLFTRLGLRYINHIRPRQLGLAGTPWKDLLKPHIAGPLAEDVIVQHTLRSANGTLSLAAADQDITVILRYGLAQDPQDPQGEPVYAIDGDFYTEGQTHAGDVLTFLESANREAGRLFRWCITDTLHRALQPHDS